MANPFKAKSWSPYLVGAGIGALSWFAFLSADHPLGITTAMEHTAGLAEAGVTEAAGVGAYVERENPKIGWEWMLVVGVFLGSLISSVWSGDRERISVPAMWRWRFGNSVALRFAFAFVGGALMLFGARLAKGCTSGHGISGALQLAVSSWVFAATIFATGIAVTFAMYGKEGRRHV